MMQTPQLPDPETLPEARATPHRRWSLQLVWLIPVIAALIGGWLAIKAVLDRGPTIQISFSTAEGLEAEKTRVKYRSVDIGRVIRMLLLHDLVEIDTGDVPIHSQNGQAHGSAAVTEAEARAADRIFGLLPSDIGQPLRALWEEFEASETADAIFAKSLDRVQPLLHNIASGGGSWIDYNVTFEQLEERVGQKVARGAPRLWPYVRDRARHFFFPD